MEAARMVILAVAFGVLVTAHVALLFVLGARRPRWRAAVAFIVPPLAPYWGWQERARAASATWVFGLVFYAVALLMALR